MIKIKSKSMHVFIHMNLKEFINLVNEDKTKFINYCEIVIGRDGSIYLPKFSGHINILEYIYTEEHGGRYPGIDNYTTDLLKGTNAVMVSYYSSISYDKLNKEQNHVYQTLLNNDLILDDLTVINKGVY